MTSYKNQVTLSGKNGTYSVSSAWYADDQKLPVSTLDIPPGQPSTIPFNADNQSDFAEVGFPSTGGTTIDGSTYYPLTVAPSAPFSYGTQGTGTFNLEDSGTATSSPYQFQIVLIGTKSSGKQQVFVTFDPAIINKNPG